MQSEIRTKKSYHETMVEIYDLMNKGETQLSKAELRKLHLMAKAAEKFEDEVLGLRSKVPKTIVEAIEVKLFERKMTRTELASELGLGKSKVSEILSGKRKCDVTFLKGVHKVLKIDAGFLLEHG